MRRGIYQYDGKKIDIESTNEFISNLISSNQPSMVTRIGSVELKCLYEFLNNRKFSNDTWNKMRNNAGFFPVNENTLKEFCEVYIKCLNDADLIGIWYNKGENQVINKFSNQTMLCDLKNLEPYYHPSNPWTKSLAGKKVLVIHPFSESISQQYERNRNRIFKEENMLPTFDLHTLKSVQSISGNSGGHKSWFEALNFMQNAIDSVDYDVALIGAGAYGLPLASYIKARGKIAIHLGGATQILFGIKGKRWDKHPFISSLYNENWTRPTQNEIPNDFKNVEGGCYW
ncbi:hypothetical protein COA18_15445 [Priestia megaterium]|nr:hypothetical protein COA18_15445 [Priestia megaterium]